MRFKHIPINMFSNSDLWIISLLLISLPPFAHGFIMCKCDTAECLAANITECRADFYCYVSFRPARPTEQKPSNSKTAYGSGSKLFIAEHRGCASNEHMDLCMNPRNNILSSGGGFGNLEPDDDFRSTIIRCCSDNYCEISQKLEFTPAELEGRQFFLNAEISDLEPGLDFPMVENALPVFRESPETSTSNSAIIPPHRKRENAENLQQKQRKRPTYLNDVPFSHQWFPGVPNPLPSPSSHNKLPPTNFGTHVKTTNRDAPVKREEIHRAPVQLRQIHKETDEERKDDSGPTIVFQPLHIAIVVCLVILMLVAVLLHVVVILHKRHRRLKQELIKQTQKTTSGDFQRNWLIDSPSQGNGQQINLQQLKYLSSPTEQNLQNASKSSDRSCCISYVFKRPQNKITAASTNVYDEVLSHQTPISTPVMPAVSTPEAHFRQYLPHEPLASSSQTPVTYHSSLHSSVATPPSHHVTQAMSLHPNPMISVLQPTTYSPHSAEHNFHLNQVKNCYGTGSSVSGGSGNNPSTAESSLPTHSSVVNGWSNMNSAQAFFLHNGLTLSMQRNSHLERPSLSGSSEAGGLVTPDFEARRANVALPPALQGGDHTCPGIPSPQANTTSLALFRSAAPQHDTCSLVTPYAQLQLSLSLNQYDTPEQIFGDGTASAGGSASLDGIGTPRNNNQASSNPTTNSSLLHSYCEQAGTGDFRV